MALTKRNAPLYFATCLSEIWGSQVLLVLLPYCSWTYVSFGVTLCDLASYGNAWETPRFHNTLNYLDSENEK